MNYVDPDQVKILKMVRAHKTPVVPRCTWVVLPASCSTALT